MKYSIFKLRFNRNWNQFDFHNAAERKTYVCLIQYFFTIFAPPWRRITSCRIVYYFIFVLVYNKLPSAYVVIRDSVYNIVAMYKLNKYIEITFKKKYNIHLVANARSFLTISDMPKPRSLPVIGTRLDFLAAGGANKLHEYIDSRHKQLGPIFTERLGSSADLVFLSDPELIKALFMNLEGKYPMHILPEPWVLYESIYGSQRGLFFMNGQEWLTNRRVVNKHLMRGESVDNMIAAPIEKTIQEFVQSWRLKLENGCLITNIESELYKLSTNVIINILLGSHSLKRSLHYNEILTVFSDSVKKIFLTTTKLYSVPLNWCQRLNLKVWRDFKESVDLSLFLAKKMSREMINSSSKNNGLIKRLVEEGMQEEIITRIVADLIIAAGDTTTYTTLWTLILLSINKDVANETRLMDQKYINYVVKESMRLYPVAPFLTRILPRETVLGKYKLNEGTPIIASIYTTGRDEHNFSKPNTFLPYRWDKNDPRIIDLVNHVPSATLPFAMGARSCIGKKIAMKQLTEFVTEIIKNFDFKCTNDKSINSITSQVLIPDRHIDLYLSVRK